MTAWPAIETDLRRALTRAGRPAPVVDRIIANLRPAFVAVERARGAVDDELIWALIGLQADRYRRHARHERIGVVSE